MNKLVSSLFLSSLIMFVAAINLLPNVDAHGFALMSSKQDIKVLSNAVLLFKLDNKRLPSSREGLHALVSSKTYDGKPSPKYMDRLPRDSWGSEYIYKIKNSSFEILSPGPNKIDENGKGDDIVSWNKEYHCELYNDCYSLWEKMGEMLFGISLIVGLFAIVLYGYSMLKKSREKNG